MVYLDYILLVRLLCCLSKYLLHILTMLDVDLPTCIPVFFSVCLSDAMLLSHFCSSLMDELHVYPYGSF